MSELLLKAEGVNTYYGAVHALRDLSLDIPKGEIVCLLGGNASGKSTTLKTLLGFAPPSSGSIEFLGEDIFGMSTTQIVSRGISLVPENRRIFGRLTVKENLEMGAYLRDDRAEIDSDFDRVLELFPRLKERMSQLGGTMSGGEQQMLAMGRALMSRPKLLLMDEPSMGLAPRLVEQSFEIIQEINERGMSVFMVEQNANMALSIAHRGYVLQTGRVVLADTAEGLLANEDLKRAYLGV